jgi:hypothetical protein
MMPHFVHTIRRPNVGTGTWSGQASTFKMAWWWHCQQDTARERTPFSRVLPRVIDQSQAGDVFDRLERLSVGDSASDP